MLTTKVVITGLGTLTPIGSDVGAYWNSFVSGQSGVEPIPMFDATQH